MLYICTSMVELLGMPLSHFCNISWMHYLLKEFVVLNLVADESQLLTKLLSQMMLCQKCNAETVSLC